MTVSLVTGVQPAAAASGTVTLNYGDWNCFAGGTVKSVWAAIDQGGQVNWTLGNKVTTWSILNTRVQINSRLLCYRPWYRGGSYYTYNFYAWRWFSFNGHSTWI